LLKYLLPIWSHWEACVWKLLHCCSTIGTSEFDWFAQSASTNISSQITFILWILSTGQLVCQYYCYWKNNENQLHANDWRFILFIKKVHLQDQEGGRR
jgi:hypothetical protein